MIKSDNKFLLDLEKCKHCGNDGVIHAVNWDEDACWVCIQDNLVNNPTGLGWSK